MSEGIFIYVSTGVCTILCLCVCCACMPRYVCVFMCISEDRFLCVNMGMCVTSCVCWGESAGLGADSPPSFVTADTKLPGLWIPTLYLSGCAVLAHASDHTQLCCVPEIQTCIHKPAKQGLHWIIFPAPFLYINGSRQFGARMAVSTSEQVLFCLPALRERARVKPEKESPQAVHSRVLLSLCRTFRPAAVETQCLGTQMPIITHCHAHEALLSLGQSFCRKTNGLSLSLSPSVTTSEALFSNRTALLLISRWKMFVLFPKHATSEITRSYHGQKVKLQTEYLAMKPQRTQEKITLRKKGRALVFPWECFSRIIEIGSNFLNKKAA